MDGFAFDYVPPATDAVQRAAPFVPPVCVSPLTAQVLGVALVILVVLALQGSFSQAKGPAPVSVRDLLLLSAFYALLTMAIWIAGMMAGIAAPVAWRIEVARCVGERCTSLPASAHRWGGRFACEQRAADLARYADLAVRLPDGVALRARCVGVDGLPGA